MHGLKACLLKYMFFAFRIYAQRGENDAKRGGKRGHALNSHGNYIVDHGRSWKNHGIMFLNFCGNPVKVIWDGKSDIYIGYQDMFKYSR